MSQHEDKVLLALTFVIGAVVGLVVVAFILLTERIGARLYPPGSAAWRRVTLPALGSLVTGVLLYLYFPEARGSGIPQTKAALFVRDGFISLRTVLGKFTLSSAALASGVALGREGPSVQVGAGIASVLGRWLGLRPASIKALVPVGASAALAAAFNTPIAAVLFSLEEVMGDMHAPVLGSIVVSSATSWIVLHLLLGDEPLFHVPAYQLVHPLEFGVYAALGVIGGLVSVCFVKLLLWQRKHFLAMPPSTRWLQPLAGGLLVGLLGWIVPEVLGVGYGFVGQALNGELVLRTMALLVVLKIFATATCYASGNAGGIFGPTLFIGAMMGGAVGGVAHNLLPDYTGNAGAYALVGMGAAFAGIVRAPLTSAIMIFEITRDYSIIVPLMIVNLLSYFISSRLQEDPIYEALQHQDGIHLPSGARAREGFLTVLDASRQNCRTILATERVDAAASGVERSGGAWPVVDQNGLRGMISAAELDAAMEAGRAGEQVGNLVSAPDPRVRLTAENFPHVHSDHPLDLAMRRLYKTGLTVLPVVSRANVRDLKGTVSLQDILSAYGIGRSPDAEPVERDTSSERTIGRAIGLLAVVVGFVIVSGLFAYYYRAQQNVLSQRYYRTGNEWMERDRFQEAIADYRRALSISHSEEHRLALALALIKTGGFSEAAIYLREFLQSNPNNGPANLGLAQISAQQGNIDEAVGSYHRAAYGAWIGNARNKRAEVRIELIHELKKAGRQMQAQGELLALAADLPDDPGMRRTTARLLLEFNRPKEAAELFRGVLKQDDRDPAAYAGLGDAKFAMLDFRSARVDYQSALRLNPSDLAVQNRLLSCERILERDPNAPGLEPAERYERTRTILLDVMARLKACGGDGQTPSAKALEALDAARKAVASRRSRRSYTEAAQSNLSMAKNLWSVRPTGCRVIVSPTDPLPALLAIH